MRLLAPAGRFVFVATDTDLERGRQAVADVAGARMLAERALDEGVTHFNAIVLAATDDTLAQPQTDADSVYDYVYSGTYFDGSGDHDNKDFWSIGRFKLIAQCSSRFG